jgi:hypothetical protein
MSKHTPGPWAKNKYGELRGADGAVVSVWDAGLSFGERNATTEANARVMQHSPDLLEALEGCVLLLTEMGHKDLTTTITARAAIAKAKGE